MSQATLSEVQWHFPIGTKGNRRYVVRQKKSGVHAADPTGGYGLYDTFVEEMFIDAWHLNEDSLRRGFGSYEHALQDLDDRMKEWH